MGKRGNGMEKPEDGQTALELDQEIAAPAAEQVPPENAEAVANSVMELGNNRDNCWKVLADGERVEISDKEWRKELTRLLAPSTPQAS